MPLMITTVTGNCINCATWRPITVNATRPSASASRNRLRRRRITGAIRAVSSAAPAVIHKYSGWITQVSG